MSPTERYFHPEIGFNYRLTNIQAALGLAQLERLDEFVEIKRRHAARYAEQAGWPARHRVGAAGRVGQKRLLDVLDFAHTRLRFVA